MNLFEETCDAFEQYDIEWEEVIWIGGNDFEIPLRDFIRLAKETDYDEGYGRQWIASDLTIITLNGRFVREEYDGSEWWQFIPSVVPYHKYSNVTSLKSRTGWQTLAEIYKEEHKNALS